MQNREIHNAEFQIYFGNILLWLRLLGVCIIQRSIGRLLQDSFDEMLFESSSCN